jgi:hypothetical protein
MQRSLAIKKMSRRGGMFHHVHGAGQRRASSAFEVIAQGLRS